MRKAAAIESLEPGALRKPGPGKSKPAGNRSDGMQVRPASQGQLSVAVIERRLGLPPGAWRRRHLVALRVVGTTCLGLGLRPGDHLVVEPGARTSVGTLVLVRAGDELAVRRVVRDGAGRTILIPADPAALPFPSRLGRHAVMGTVLGALPAMRPAANAVRGPDVVGCVSLGTRRQGERDQIFRAHGRFVSSARRDAARDDGRTRSDPAAANAMRFRVSLEAWRRWVQGALAPESSGTRVARWRALEARLQTLTSCLDVTGPSPLRRALAREGETVLRAMKREVAAVEAQRPAGTLDKDAKGSSVASEPHSRLVATDPPVQGDLFGPDGVDRRATRMVLARRRGAGRSLRRGPVTS